MNDILNSPSVLRLNANMMRLGWSTPQQAFCMLMGGEKNAPPALAVDVQYELNEYGQPVTEKIAYFEVLDWEHWLALSVRPGELDQVVHTSKRIIRIPTIIVCRQFAKMPMKEQKVSPKAIRQRDGNRCQYTGVELTNRTFSLDHIVPKSKGGKNSWHNLVAAHKDVNTRKGDKFNHEVGLKLIKRPSAPKSIPLCALHQEVKHPDHRHF